MRPECVPNDLPGTRESSASRVPLPYGGTHSASPPPTASQNPGTHRDTVPPMTTNEPMVCERCQQQHDPTKCTGHTTAGNPCRNRPIRGGSVCSTHGGSAPQVRAKAEERVAEGEAQAAVAQLWPGLANASPVKDPVELLERLAGGLEQMVDVLGTRVDALAHLEAGADLTRVRGQVLLFEKLLGHLRQTAVEMARLGIAERQVRIDEAIAGMVIGAAHAGLNALDLVPSDRTLFLRAFLDELGAAGQVVAGDVVAS